MKPRSSTKKLQDDFVELPKINFAPSPSQSKKRKPSDVIINLPDIESET